MKKIICISLSVICLALTLNSCSTPQSLFRKGNYYEAVVKAVNKLRNKPQNVAAQTVLSDAYPMAQDLALRVIANQQANISDPMRHYAIVEQYEMLNRLANEIYHCPAALQIVSNPAEYIGEINLARQNGAEEFYRLGVAALQTNDIHQARQALNYFQRTNDFVLNYNDVQKKIEQAVFYSTLRVIVQRPIITQRYQISSDFFFANLMTELRRQGTRRLVEFYGEEEAKLANITAPHHYVTLDFTDFTVGNTREINNTINCKKDSVIVGYSTVDGKKYPAYNTVTAKLNNSRLELQSGGMLSVLITDATTRKTLGQQHFSGNYLWVSEWATFSGDDRALTDQQKRLLNRQREMPPAPQDLFVEFTKPIFSKTVSYLINYYSKF